MGQVPGKAAFGVCVCSVFGFALVFFQLAECANSDRITAPLQPSANSIASAPPVKIRDGNSPEVAVAVVDGLRKNLAERTRDLDRYKAVAREWESKYNAASRGIDYMANAGASSNATALFPDAGSGSESPSARSAIEDVEAAFSDVEYAKSKVVAAQSDMEDAVLNFSILNWRDVVPEVRQADEDLQYAVRQLRNSMDDLETAISNLKGL